MHQFNSLLVIALLLCLSSEPPLDISIDCCVWSSRPILTSAERTSLLHNIMRFMTLFLDLFLPPCYDIITQILLAADAVASAILQQCDEGTNRFIVPRRPQSPFGLMAATSPSAEGVTRYCRWSGRPVGFVRWCLVPFCL